MNKNTKKNLHARTVGLTGVLVGVMLATATMNGSEFLALSRAGYDPNDIISDGMKTVPHTREALEKYYAERALQREKEERLDMMELRMNNRKEKRMNKYLHMAAPKSTDNSAVDSMHCNGLSGVRLAKCRGQFFKDGTVYQLRPRADCDKYVGMHLSEQTCKAFRIWTQ